MKPDYEKLTVEEAYQLGLARKIGIPGLASASPLANGKTAVGVSYAQPSNNGAFVSLADLYPSLTEAEKAMTVAQYLKTKKPKNTIIWILAVIGLVLMTYVGLMLAGIV